MDLPYMILHFLCLCIKSDYAVFSSTVVISCEDSDTFSFTCQKCQQNAGKTEK